MGVKLALLCSIKGFNVILWNNVAKNLSILYKQAMIDAVSAKYAKNITKQALDRIFFY